MNSQVSKAEGIFKLISTYGTAVCFSAVLLGYFLWKDYSQSGKHLDALNNNTEAMTAVVAAMGNIEDTVKEQAETVQKLKVIIEANTRATEQLRDEIESR